MNCYRACVLLCLLLVCDISVGQPATPKSTQSRDEMLLFFPSKYPEGNWEPKNLDCEEVHFTAKDGTRLHAWYCPCEQPLATVLIAHGNGGHLAHRAAWLSLLQKKSNVATFIFDYRGYGRSEGVPTVEGILMDARAAQQKLCEHTGLKQTEIVLMGESLGGAVAVQLAAESAPRGLVLQSTFGSLQDIAAVHYPQLAWLVPKGKLNSLEIIPRYRGPLLQSHGDADRVIPFSSGKKLSRQLRNPKHSSRSRRLGTTTG